MKSRKSFVAAHIILYGPRVSLSRPKAGFLGRLTGFPSFLRRGSVLSRVISYRAFANNVWGSQQLAVAVGVVPGQKESRVESNVEIPAAQNGVNRRARNEASKLAAKRRKLNDDEELPIYATKFSKEEIDAEERQPKRKVAVMIGYSGSGYKGMQINHHEKTIEGDLFAALVAAGAISKANADDPKKSSFVRCARTDRGVHAAGNIVSLKMIIEDPDIVRRINDKLSPQIRIWGFERTNGTFNAYYMCDSRIYEYLIPTHCFLPPHPDTFLGRNMAELAEESGDEGYQDRQKDVCTYWTEAEENYIKPYLETLESELRARVENILHEPDAKSSLTLLKFDSMTGIDDIGPAEAQGPSKVENEEFEPKTPNSNIQLGASPLRAETQKLAHSSDGTSAKDSGALEEALRNLKKVIVTAKKAYRIHPDRLARVRSTLSRYVGTHNFHNYTVSKAHRDPSAKRVIKSFTTSDSPIIINDTEWLSLKVHGQSFMMHQIRKMVTMAAMVVRCGCHEGRMQDSYMEDKLSIPKAPSLGLLLERPVFDSYNIKNTGESDAGRGRLDFGKYEKEMAEFKQREIYERIFREEERDHQFHTFFSALDNLKSPNLLFLSSVGISASRRPLRSETGAEKPETVVPDEDFPSSEDEETGQGDEG
ncbi:MAG: hypothetical protein Q9214_004440 [Letrouitia sp. 1 TL-2023]